METGLLQDKLAEDMKRVFTKKGLDCAAVDALRFYPRHPDPESERQFQEYVKARWPLITFALYPQVDQQNIDDVSNTTRDVQLALAFAFSSGQINLPQLTQFQRRVETDAEVLALNRTVTSFSHGDDTFGYRFSPRYQNAPQEGSNLGVAANLLFRGGPGRNYRLKNSKLEAGQRELNAVIIMPSFLQGIQMDVTGNWFPLHDPDEMEIPTARMPNQGRKVVELRESLACIHDHKHYRPGDIQRLETRVPYENSLGGFSLFQEGVTSLVPGLSGFEGADAIDGGQEIDLLLYGKNFSIQETHIVVGGKFLPPDNLDESLNAATKAATGGTGAVAKQETPAKGAAATNDTPAPKNTPVVEVISREVTRVHIPSGVLPTTIRGENKAAGLQYVEMYVATPNGISNRLLIPYGPNTANGGTPAGSPQAGTGQGGAELAPQAPAASPAGPTGDAVPQAPPKPSPQPASPNPPANGTPSTFPPLPPTNLGPASSRPPAATPGRDSRVTRSGYQQPIPPAALPPLPTRPATPPSASKAGKATRRAAGAASPAPRPPFGLGATNPAGSDPRRAGRGR